MKTQINFYTRNLYDLQDIDRLKIWIENVIERKGFKYSEINYTFYTDEELWDLNKKYLDHNYYTDILTFDNTINKTISADIAISIDRVKDNAVNATKEIGEELRRVMIHGILHCIGMEDITETDRRIMRKEEDIMLDLFHVEHVKNGEDV